MGDEEQEPLAPAASTWWGDEPAQKPAASRQGVFWADESDLPEEPLPASEPGNDEDVVVPFTDIAVDRNRNNQTNDARKARTMSAFRIGRFLEVNGALYDGRDDSRWLRLPVKRREPRFQMMKQPIQRAFTPAAGRTFSGLRPLGILG